MHATGLSHFLLALVSVSRLSGLAVCYSVGEPSSFVRTVPLDLVRPGPGTLKPASLFFSKQIVRY